MAAASAILKIDFLMVPAELKIVVDLLFVDQIRRSRCQMKGLVIFFKIMDILDLHGKKLSVILTKENLTKNFRRECIFKKILKCFFLTAITMLLKP